MTLGACATSSSSDKDPKASRKAAETNTALGRSYLGRGQYEIALEKLKRAIGYDRTYAPAHTVLAVLYQTIGEDQKAGDEYRLAVRYDPENGDVNNNYGVYLCGDGSYEEAIPHFETAVGDPFYRTPEIAYANAGNCALQYGHVDKAEVYLRKSLDYDARFANALLPMAELSLEKGDHLRARGFLQRYESAAAQTEASLYVGYQVETALGDNHSAEQYLQALRTGYPQAESLTKIGQEEE